MPDTFKSQSRVPARFFALEEGIMRRKDKEIKDLSEINRILQEAPLCRIAMAEENKPYLICVNYAVEGDRLFFHSASSGKKIDILKRNPFVCFEIDLPGALVKSDTACRWTMTYRSVVGFGKAFFLDSKEEKTKVFDRLMKKYAGRDGFSYSDEALDKARVIGILIESVTGKRSG
jgi:nitroimidazol reductase NimA-like FMN-containing flavoprotein (pyridoxamine 5'-phosphate oxidase superfamily)